MGDYWKNMMKGQPMPEQIKDLVQDPLVSDTGKDRFVRDFDIKPNVILYHTRVVSKQQKQKQKPFVKNIEAESKKPDGMVEKTIRIG